MATKEAQMAALRETLGRPPSATPAPARPSLRLAPVANAAVRAAQAVIKEIRVREIDPDPGQPRKDFDEDELRGLATSLRRGQLTPIGVYQPRGSKRFTVVWGGRRLAAALLTLDEEASIEWLTARVFTTLPTESEIRDYQLIENLQRSDLKPMELAHALQDRLKARGCSQSELADYYGISRARVSNAIKWLDAPSDVQQLVAQGKVAASVATEIRDLPAKQQSAIAKEVAAKGLSREEVRSKVAAAKGLPPREDATKGKDGLLRGATNEPLCVQEQDAERRPAGGRIFNESQWNLEGWDWHGCELDQEDFEVGEISATVPIGPYFYANFGSMSDDIWTLVPLFLADCWRGPSWSYEDYPEPETESWVGLQVRYGGANWVVGPPSLAIKIRARVELDWSDDEPATKPPAKGSGKVLAARDEPVGRYWRSAGVKIHAWGDLRAELERDEMAGDVRLTKKQLRAAVEDLYNAFLPLTQ